MNFGISLIFPIQPFLTWPEGHDKIRNILRTKRAFKMKQKAFFIIFKVLPIEQITQITFFGG